MKTVIASTAFCLLWLWGITVPAQVTTGQISGTVKDPSGAAVPSVSVTVVDEQNSLTRRATTDADGFYLVSNLPAGSYQVRVEQQGFKSFVRSGLQLAAGDRADIGPALEIGDVAEVVTVSTEGELVNTESGTVGQLVDGSQVRDLAINGRNPAQLLMLVPGVTVTTDQYDRGGIAFGSVGALLRQRFSQYVEFGDGRRRLEPGQRQRRFRRPTTSCVDFIGGGEDRVERYSAEYGAVRVGPN